MTSLHEPMVTVRMLFDKRGGGRHDGREWPAYGETFTVSEQEAEQLIAIGDAEPATAPVKARGWDVLRDPNPDWDSAPEEEEARQPEPTALSNSDLGDDDFDRDVTDDDDDNDFGGDDYEPRTLKPAAGEKKAAWIKWAVECGASIDEANAMTKADLIARYGK